MPKNLLHRSLSIFILCPVLLFAIYWNQWTYFTLFGVVLVLGIKEFFEMFPSMISSKMKILGITISFFIYTLTFLSIFKIIDIRYLIFIPICFLLMLTIKLYDKKEKNIFQNLSILILGILYLSVPLSVMHLCIYTNGTYSPEIILIVLFGVWANDTGGYIFGSLFGKYKLFERISKKKTWEGLIGGFVLSILVGYICSMYFNICTILVNNRWIITGIIINMFSTYGDFVESMLKRNVQIKDCSNLIPGHGGILDRFDSFLFAIVGIVFYATILDM